MGFLSKAVAEVKASNSHDLFIELYGGRKAKSGQSVNLDTAVRVSAVFGCLRVIGNGRAQIPLKLRQQVGRKRTPAVGNPLYNLMAVKPNRWQTSFQWRQMMSWHVELDGNHYSYISRFGDTVVELYPFTPNQVECKDMGRGEFEYKVTYKDGTTQTFAPSQILHVRGPSWDGVTGMSVLGAAREAIGLAMASEESASSLHKNGIRSSGVYSVEGTLKPEQHDSLMKQILKHNGGPENDGKPMVIDRAAKWLTTQMTGKDAQALETRRYQLEEVCRFFGTFPIMIGYSDKTATYASAEQMFLAHLQHCLSPRWTSDEQTFDTALLTEKEREQGFYFDYVEEGMIRGSIKDTKDTILGYVNGGILTPNEGRELLDREPIDDAEADQLRNPANITGAGTAPEPSTTE